MHASQLGGYAKFQSSPFPRCDFPNIDRVGPVVSSSLPEGMVLKKCDPEVGKRLNNAAGHLFRSRITQEIEAHSHRRIIRAIALQGDS